LSKVELMGQEMPIKCFNGDEISPHLNGGDKELIFRAETCKKKGDLFLLFERLIYGSKSVHKPSKFVEITRDRRISLFESRELIVNIHSASPRMGSEHPFESEPDLSRCCAFDNIG
jgi:hypothetical protein